MKISFDKINVNYGRIKAVEDFTYEFSQGVYGLIGETAQEKQH